MTDKKLYAIFGTWPGGMKLRVADYLTVWNTHFFRDECISTDVQKLEITKQHLIASNPDDYSFVIEEVNSSNNIGIIF